ncbi:amidase [Ahrensia sp. R2A130]|uniref:amidase n=1 Tax=Ahrensia sp. R2A130 TaxID=744979 RepID=UPI0001E0E837|nr:amidase [Ahrensia sp. R2A130]EFL90915.1 glutamyl-tRNA(Gln) amidotransferase subunit A [Ahrensia sp. R2A130]
MEMNSWQQQIHAFVGTLELPWRSERARLLGTGEDLSGLTVGVKDVINVVGLPTGNGSLACAGAEPKARDADVVASLRDAGASIIGKTTTTEFAFTDPTECRNPHDLRRTPGGSSSGSGAAVAAGMVDMALGTQTAGSLIRPACYCGVVGLKPTYGWLSRNGVTPLAPSFDTVGIIAGSVGLAGRGLRAMAGQMEDVDEVEGMATFGGLLPAFTAIDIDASSAFQDASRILASLSSHHETGPLPVDVDTIVRHHRTVMNFEAFLHHGDLLEGRSGRLLKPKFRTGLQQGAEISRDAYDDARARLNDAQQEFWAWFADRDVVLTLAVPEGAPLLGETTGFQDWLTPWTVFGGPLLALPWGLDRLGRPRSIMLAGRPGEDMHLLAIARMLEKKAPSIPPPVLPKLS